MRQEEFELKWGIKTINDARGERGYDPIPEGNTPLIANGFVPLNAAVNPAPAPVVARKLETREEIGIKKKIPMVTSEYKDYFWRQFDGITEANAQSMENVFQIMLKQIKQQVFQLAGEGVLSLATVDVSPEDLVEYDAIIAEACNEVAQELYATLAIEGGVPPTAEVVALVEESSAKIRDSIGVIKQEVQATLTANAGKDKDELFKILNTKFDSLQTSRARAIANTTAANVTSGMQYAVYKDEGFKMVWLTQRDGRVRPSHARMEGSTQGADGYFTVVTEIRDTDNNIIGTTSEKTKRPLGSGLSASNAVNCRCQLFPVEVQGQIKAPDMNASTEQNAVANITKPQIIAGGRGSQLKAITDFEAKYKNLRTHEMGMVADYNGNVINEVKGDKRSVNNMKGLSLEKIRQLIKEGNVVETHNHPEPASLSGPDIMVAMTYNRAEMRAVHKNYTYIMQRPKSGYLPREKYKKNLIKSGKYIDDGFELPEATEKKIANDWINKFQDAKYIYEDFPNRTRAEIPENMLEIYDAYLEGKFDGPDSYTNYNEYLTHYVNIEMAKKYEYDYQRIPTR
jgi:hypothetical protein